MPMMAVAFPILPGKTEDWRAWMAEANGHDEPSSTLPARSTVSTSAPTCSTPRWATS